ncbi:MAG: thylakoid membrane photosystem I accumulation factor [Prochlorotrichaceae cyanobacterium]
MTSPEECGDLPILFEFVDSLFLKIMKRLTFAVISILCALLLATIVHLQPAYAGMNDDHFDGNIFALYAGNGSLVPPRSRLKDSLRNHRVAIILFYLDDSRDSKAFASTYSQLQAWYGRAADLIPLSVDSLLPDTTNTPEDEGYYYTGQIPQVVIINQAGEVILNEVGQISYEKMDDVLRVAFDLVPRSESEQLLRRKSFNEFSSELTLE